MAKVSLLQFKNYLNTIKKSTGSRLFRNLYIKEKGETKDLLNDGEYACAYFVTCILKLFKAINEVHSTVNGTLKDLKKAGWKEVNLNDMQAGDILLWKHNGKNEHIGFCIGKNKAISNSSEKKSPVQHSYDFAGKRPVMKVLRYIKW